MEIISLGKGNSKIAEELEKKLNITLPIDYKNFLDSQNGAKIIDGHFFVKGLDQEIAMNLLYGNDLEKRAFNLEFWHQEFGDDIPDGGLLIGTDPGGGFILLINDGKENGIYYYDHSYFFKESSDEHNTYFIAETFTMFMEMLKSI
jgi:hypothetical protein